MGFHAAVLRYSTAPARFPEAILQLAQAVVILRENAIEWGIDTQKIVVQGSSAGGHLAASLFDTDPSKPLTGGIQTTGNYPGRARTPEELMADLDMVLKLCPGTKKMNLHASYAIFEDGDWADRNKLEPRHFAKWVDFCMDRGLPECPEGPADGSVHPRPDCHAEC